MPDSNPGHQCPKCSWYNAETAEDLDRHLTEYHKVKDKNKNKPKKPGN